jgi:hypothetical protein
MQKPGNLSEKAEEKSSMHLHYNQYDYSLQSRAKILRLFPFLAILKYVDLPLPP